ncbi:MAG: PAS domain S-box protein [Deltaproteobacteria bacterium]|nr:PAS domain S-box protein [Deltaproteobacteria bacterium]
MSKKPTDKELAQRIRESEKAGFERQPEEKALQEQMAHMRVLMDVSLDGIAIIDQKHRVVESNRRFAEMLGYTPEEVLSLHTWDWEAVMSEAEIRANFADLAKTKTTFETRHRRKDGTIYDAEVTACGAKLGDETMVLTIIRDITDRKEADSALKQSESRYRALFENMSDGVAIYEAVDDGENFLFVDFNEAAERIDNVRKEAVLGRRVTDVFPGVKEFGLVDVFRRVWKTGRSERHPVSMYKDERIVGWRDNFVYKLPSGEIVAIYSDETRSKQAEETLHEALLRWNEAVKAGNVGLWDWDLKSNKVQYSKEWKSQIGYEKHEITDDFEEWRSRVHPDDLEPTLKKVNQSINENRAEHKVEFRFRHKNGSYRWILAQASILRDENGNPIRMLGSHIDITERKLAEEEFAQIFSMSLDMICIADINTSTFVKVNAAFTETLGFSEAELLERPFLDFIHPDDIDSTRLVVEEKLRMGAKVVYFDNRYRCKDGSYRWLSWVSHPDPERGVTYAVARDITEWKQNEEAIQRTKAILDATGRMAKVGGWEVDANTHEVTWTEETYRIHEMPLDYKPPLQKAIDFFYPEDRDKLGRAIQRALDQGEPYDMELRFVTAKGKELWTRTICMPEIVDGKTVRLRGTFQDITDRKQAEEALWESERKYRRIFENIQDVYYEASLDGTILECSPSVEDISQYKKKELIGMSFYDIYADPKERDEFVKQVLVKGKVNDFEISLIDKDGSKHPCSVTTSVMKDVQGNPIKLVGSLHDISERKRGEEERKKLEAQIRHSQKMEAIGTLAGGIAHDFNNILSVIVGYGQLVQTSLDHESEVYEDLKEVLQSADRAKNLIQQILAIGRSQEQERQTLQLKHIVREALKFLRSTLPSTIEIQEKIDNDVGVIDADPTQMHQVLMNLCTNAGHAMEKDGGTLTVSLGNVTVSPQEPGPDVHLEPGRYLSLSVSDTGHGIAPEIREKIFNPYFTTKETGTGTGIGLSVVHGIVSQHGGAVTVESEPGKGSTFHIYLPLIQGEEAESDTEEETPPPTGNERILFIDDEAALARVAKRMLKTLGYDVTAITSSPEALALFKKDPKQFDLVITDTTMPHMPGDVLAQEMMKIRPDIPVIICTGHSKRISPEKAEEMGIKGFLMKPLAIRGVAGMVRKVLDEK